MLQYFSVFLLLAAPIVLTASEKVTFCYWGTWSHYRPGNGQFRVENIDPKLCTHLGYAFFGLGNDGEIKSLDSWLDNDLKNVEKTVALKKANPKLKVMASVGGWNEGSAKYSAMAADASKRAKFIKSSVNFVRQNGFDGLDLDWEYPAQRDGAPADRSNFVTLLKELNAALKEHNLLLTVAVAAGAGSAGKSYDIPSFSKHVDLINLMTYDFATAGDGKAGFNSPLEGQGENSVKAAVTYWLKQGAPANKLVVGLPAYGRSFTLSSASANTPGAATSGAGAAGPITQEGGYLGYNEICEKLKSGWKSVFDATHKVPYAYQGNQWVGYDDKKSIAEKVAFVKKLNLAGAMVWSIETEDFKGNCGEKFPLLKTIRKVLAGEGGDVDTKPDENENSGKDENIEVSQPDQEPPKKDDSEKPGNPVDPVSPMNDGSCKIGADGVYPNPEDCTSFIKCVAGSRYDFVCPAGLHFDKSAMACNWPEAANCSA